MRRGSDSGVSAIIGAVVILGVLGTALVYVNAFHVPRQGAVLEVAAAEEAERALLRLSSSLTSTSPTFVDVPLQGPRTPPPLLSGLVLSPVRAGGSLVLDPRGPNVTLSMLIDAPPEGVPPADPIRRDAGAGKMRVWLIGNATHGHHVGALDASVGGAYLEPSVYRLEAGGLFAKRAAGSTAIAAPTLVLGRGGSASAPTTTFSWTLPMLAGASPGVNGASVAQVTLAPGPLAEMGGGSRVHNLTLTVETTSRAAWEEAMRVVVGGRGHVNVTSTGPDAGIVKVDVGPPSDAAPGARSVELRLWTVRTEVRIADRVGG